jgi:hypothetical protein
MVSPTGKPCGGYRKNRGIDLDEWLTQYGVTIAVGALILFMLFIVWDLAKRSNAGRFGTVILYIGLGLGIFGFLMKFVISWLIESAG